MTSKKAMFTLIAIALVMTGVGLGGCQRRSFDQPHVYTSPYPAPKLWAVAPFRNESGTSLVDPARFADHVAQQVQQIDGISIVPVNRVIEAMDADDLTAITSREQAMKLLNTLKVDGLLVGTVTAWDPYEPPKIGAVMQLYARQLPGGGTTLDSRRLTMSTTDVALPGMTVHSQPVATASGHFDAANGAVLKRLSAYAHGRAPDDSPAGWRRYLMNMDLYNEFVSHELMRRLFAAEWNRLHKNAERRTRKAERQDSSEFRDPSSKIQ